MGVSEASIVDWEAGKQPYDRMYPRIIAFLGYEPWSEPESLADMLVATRRRRGLSAKATAKLLEVDEAMCSPGALSEQANCWRHK